jgi:hypothetical protein
VTETLLDTDRLAEGLAAARAAYDAADSQRAGRLVALDREAARLRGRLSRILEEVLDVTPGSESALMLRDKRNQIEEALAQLARERAELATEPVAGLSPDHARSLAAFAAEVRAGLEHADEAERRRVCQLLQIRATVRLDPEHGTKLARRNRFTVRWQAVIPIRHSAHEFLNIKTIFMNDASGTSRPSAKPE